MRESVIETKMREAVEAAGGLFLKFVSPGRKGVPDRIMLLPNGAFAFVELKATDKGPRSDQEREHKRLRGLGQRVYVVDSLEAVEVAVRREMRFAELV
jgi:hypothetical protein